MQITITRPLQHFLLAVFTVSMVLDPYLQPTVENRHAVQSISAQTFDHSISAIFEQSSHRQEKRMAFSDGADIPNFPQNLFYEYCTNRILRENPENNSQFVFALLYSQTASSGL